MYILAVIITVAKFGLICVLVGLVLALLNQWYNNDD